MFKSIFNLYDWEYPEVIERTAYPNLLRAAWRKKIKIEDVYEILLLLTKDHDVLMNVHYDGRTSFAYKSDDGIDTIVFGHELSVGLVLHEFAHILLFRRAYEGHGPLFTFVLDDLLVRYRSFYDLC